MTAHLAQRLAGLGDQIRAADFLVGHAKADSSGYAPGTKLL
jgi:hypothetical protein